MANEKRRGLVAGTQLGLAVSLYVGVLSALGQNENTNSASVSRSGVSPVMIERQARREKALEAAWPKDEAKVFEWDKARCQAELDNTKARADELMKEISASFGEIATLRNQIGEKDPELKPLHDEMERLTADLEKKRQEFREKVSARAAANPDMKALEMRRTSLLKDNEKVQNLQLRIETRLSNLADESKKPVSKNKVSAGAR